MNRLPDLESSLTNDNYGRMARVYRYLRDNGECSRNRIMYWTGFPSPKDQPVLAYVEFTQTIMHLDRILRRHGWCVIGGVETDEIYSLGRV